MTMHKSHTIRYTHDAGPPSPDAQRLLNIAEWMFISGEPRCVCGAEVMREIDHLQDHILGLSPRETQEHLVLAAMCWESPVVRMAASSVSYRPPQITPLNLSARTSSQAKAEFTRLA